MSLIMKRIGYCYDEACDGQEAFDKCKEKSYDLILMDINMPVMNGLEATKKIRESDNLSKKAIILALTASTLQEDIDSCKKAGMNDYLIKPIKKEKLQEAIAKWLK